VASPGLCQVGWARLIAGVVAVAALLVLGPPAISRASGPASPAAKTEAPKGEGAKPQAAKTDDKADGKKDDSEKDDSKKDDSKKDDTKKGDSKVAAKPEAKDAKPEGKSEAVTAKDEKKESASGPGGTTKPVKKNAKAAADDEPAPPSTPPIKMAALREEMSHPVHREERTTSHAEREKLEQLASEINKAREGLRQDTAKLEAMLAARDATAQAAASPGTAPAGGDGGEPTKKVPTSLDNLAKAIRGMKPEQAAPIISRVDRKLAADVLLRMPGGDAGKVMGVCKPEVAAELAAEIASRTPRAELRR